MDRPCTQIFTDSATAKQSAPAFSRLPKEPQEPNHRARRKEMRKGAVQEINENALNYHAQDLPRNVRRRVDLEVQLPVIQRESPWNSLEDLFTCDLAGSVTIAIHEKDPSKVIAVRAFSKKNTDKWLQVLQQTKHPNVISAKEIFNDHGMTYFIVDDFPLTLEHIVACDAFPSELQLASILAQVLNGLSHLLNVGFEHQSLTCSNILLGQDGIIQIAALEHCIKRQQNQSQAQTLSALTTITMLLMQKYVKPDGIIGIDNTRWQADALGFISATASVAAVQELRKVGPPSRLQETALRHLTNYQHPLMTKHRWSARTLIGLARLCLITTRTFITKGWSSSDKKAAD